MLTKLLLFAALLFPAITCGQDYSDPARFFRLDFVVKEVEVSKTLNSRIYSSLISTKKD